MLHSYTYDNHGAIDQYIQKRLQMDDGTIQVLSQQAALTSLFKMLQYNRIDAFLENRFVAAYKARQMGLSGQVEMVPSGKSDDIFFAFTPNGQGRTLAGMLDEGVRQLRKSGELARLLSIYGIEDWQ